MIRVCSFFFNVVFFALNPVCAQQSFQTYLNDWTSNEDLKNASISFTAVDIEKNTVYAQFDKDRSLIPASSLKIITTGTSIALLGKDFNFKTKIGYTGNIEKGQLMGDLHIIGGGDPSLGSPYMKNVPSLDSFSNIIIQQLKKNDIDEISGDLVIDESYFSTQSVPMDWQWGDLGNHYGAGVFGFNIHDNLYALFFQQNQTLGNKPAIKYLRPEIPYLQFVNEVKNDHKYSGDNAYIYCAPKSELAIIRGTIPIGSKTFKIKGSIPDPARFYGLFLSEKLKKNNIKFQGNIKIEHKKTDISKVQFLFTNSSPSLIEICKHINEDSRNMYCEVLVKTLAKRIHDDPDTEKGIQSIIDFWTDRGIDPKGFFMRDGSGLSARNGITSASFANILRKMYVDKKSFGNFYDYLAIAGKTGTLSNFGKKTAIDGNIRAKSGSLNRVRSFSGYVTNADKKMLSFSIIVNNYTCKGSVMKKKLEKLLVALAESKS